MITTKVVTLKNTDPDFEYNALVLEIVQSQIDYIRLRQNCRRLELLPDKFQRLKKAQPTITNKITDDDIIKNRLEVMFYMSKTENEKCAIMDAGFSLGFDKLSEKLYAKMHPGEDGELIRVRVAV